ncbi:Ran-specific GTPase-activating protein 30 [Smittium culicis]|uniref:Ran-specific GTPase-activating protein 30 n=1 Tax=Smittium culicis TaxID=133412 RepID=A0A1R1Y0K7_9FUNG|nr:Ran-specific GTPase-activating protein 30 [Smittium culicis]
MDGFFSNIAVQTAALVGKAAFGAAGTLAMKHVSEYIKNAPKSDSKKRSDLKYLRDLFETKLKAIMPAIDLIGIMTARGNSVMKTILPLTNSLKKDIDAFIYSLEKIELGEKTGNSTNQPKKTRKITSNSTIKVDDSDHNFPLTISLPKIYRKNSSKIDNQDTTNSKSENSDYIDKISSELKQLLSKIDQAVPLLNLALSTSGINLSGSLPTGISTSRLLQASSFIVSSSSDYKYYLESLSRNSYAKNIPVINKPTKKGKKIFTLNHVPSQTNFAYKKNKPAKFSIPKTKKFSVSKPFDLKLYTLFSGSARSKSLSDFTWKEHFPRCQIQLFRIFKSSCHYTHKSSSSMPSSNKNEIESNFDFNKFNYSYSLTCTQNLNDGRYHDEIDYGSNQSKSDFIPGKSVVLDIANINKLYFSSSGTLLNIEGSNSPVLVLQIKDTAFNSKESSSKIPKLKKKLSNLKIGKNSQHIDNYESQGDENLSDDSNSNCSTSSDSDSSDEHLENEKSNRYDGYIWLALQVESYTQDSDSDSDSSSDSGFDSDFISTDSDNQYDSDEYSQSNSYSSKNSSKIKLADYNSESENSSDNNNIKLQKSTNKSPHENHVIEKVKTNSYEKETHTEHSETPSHISFSIDEWSLCSLSLLECLLRLCISEVCLQKSHLEIPDEQLMLFLSGSRQSLSDAGLEAHNLARDSTGMYRNLSTNNEISWSNNKVRNQTPVSNLKMHSKLKDDVMSTPIRIYTPLRKQSGIGKSSHSTLATSQLNLASDKNNRKK